MTDPNKLFAFTRALVDIDSTTGQEQAAAEFTAAWLETIPGMTVEVWPLAPGRSNVFASHGRPEVVLSTHLDTVPPFFASGEDEQWIHGRGACDAKGILAAQAFAAAELAARGATNFGLLFLAGEEKNSLGAKMANQQQRGCRYLVNGEPTDSRMATAGKGALRVDLRAQGRLAHSAYPELGESAIDKLLEAIDRLKSLPLPTHPGLGPTTWNIGTIGGGRAPNVVADRAQAELLYRLVQPAGNLRAAISDAVAGCAEADFVLEVPPVELLTLPGFERCTVAFTTDIPALSHWGTPILFGPGSIHVAHTAQERMGKAELVAAVDAYARLVEVLGQRN